MAPTISKVTIKRFSLICLAVLVLCFTISGCTVQRSALQPGTIPKLAAPSPHAEKTGKFLFTKLRKDYDLDSDIQKRDKLIEIFNQLAKAAEVDHLAWHIYLFDGPDVVDVRAVYGNYIFVWSGVLDVVADDDELAGLLAWELSHTLAHHTDPVKFTLASDVLFSVAEMATSIGLMMASHGAIAVVGQGWMKWAYVEVADLDPLDREYSEEQEREAAGLALLIISRTQYSPQALYRFWNRVAENQANSGKYKQISRNLSPEERAAMLEKLSITTAEGNQFAKKQTPIP